MDRPGGIVGGVIAEIRNLHSRRLYVVSTSPELGKDYWTISIMPAEEKRSLFGLSTRAVPDFHHPVASFVRNRKEDAYQIHAHVRQIVSSLPEAQWFDSFPSPKPPEGYSAGARAHLESIGIDPGLSVPSPTEVDSHSPRDAQDHAERLCSLVIALAGQIVESFARERHLSVCLPDAGKVMLRARFQQFADSMAYANLLATSRNPAEDPDGYFRDVLARYETHYLRTCTGGDPNAKRNLGGLRLEFIACTEKGIAPVDQLTAVVMSECFLPSAGAPVTARVNASAEFVRDVVAGSALDPDYFGSSHNETTRRRTADTAGDLADGHVARPSLPTKGSSGMPPPLLGSRAEQVRHDKRRYNKLSFLWGVPGLLLQAWRGTGDPTLFLAGTVLLGVGLFYYARYKGRSGWWALLGLASVPGYIILAFVKDKRPGAALPIPTPAGVPQTATTPRVAARRRWWRKGFVYIVGAFCFHYPESGDDL